MVANHEVGKMPEVAAETPMRSGTKARLMTVEQLDGRTHSARRVHQLMRAYQRQLGRKPTVIERSAIEALATLRALAEHTRMRCLTGEASMRELEAAERSVRRAERALEAAIQARDEAVYGRSAW
jgi:hypothetical protein